MIKSMEGTQKRSLKSMEDEDERESNMSKLSAFSSTIPASSIYEIINKAVNKEKLTLAWPKTFKKRI